MSNQRNDQTDMNMLYHAVWFAASEAERKKSITKLALFSAARRTEFKKH